MNNRQKRPHGEEKAKNSTSWMKETGNSDSGYNEEQDKNYEEKYEGEYNKEYHSEYSDEYEDSAPSGRDGNSEGRDVSSRDMEEKNGGRSENTEGRDGEYESHYQNSEGREENFNGQDANFDGREEMEITNEHMVEDEDRTKRLKTKILYLLMKKKYTELREETLDMHPADLASVLEDLDENNRLVVFRLLRKDVATEAFTFMSDDARAELVEGFSDAEIVNTIEEISLDEAADMLEDMPASVVKRVLAKSSRETRESLNRLLHYPEYSAGSIMTPEYVRFRAGIDVKEAMQAIREQGPDAETVYTCYVVQKNKLLGVVTARDLLLSDPDTPISEIMDDNVISVNVTDDQEYVARQLAKYDFNAMPVVDNEGMMLGIVTIDDAVDVLVDESTEDMQKMAAIIPEDQSASYFGTSVLSHAKQRIPWLLILMLSATFTGLVTQHYEASFAALPLLVSFMPMLMYTPGNCGNQACTLMVRGLALGEVTVRDLGRIVWKELRISLLVGSILGVVNGVRIFLMYDVFAKNPDPNALRYMLVVSIALMLAIILAKLVGASLPLLAKLIGADPAIMATPFITTIVDAGSLIIYFHIAELIFAAEIAGKAAA